MAIRLANREKKADFFYRINRALKKQGLPVFVAFELTLSCNFRCPYCYLLGNKKIESELETGQVLNILEQLKKLGVWKVIFTGGEPLLREDIFDIINHAFKIGLQTVLFSNGSLIDAACAEKLKKAGLHKAEITLNALSPKIFEDLSGVSGFHVKVLNAIELLKGKKIEVVVKSIAMRQNKNELIKINKLARSLNILHMIDFEVLPYRDGGLNWVNKFSLDIGEAQALRKRAYIEMFRNKQGPKNEFVRNRNRMFNCSVGKESFVISSGGKMNFCNGAAYPELDIISLGIKSSWDRLRKEVKILNEKKDFVCRECELVPYCKWCPGLSFLETQTFNSCLAAEKKSALEQKELQEKGVKHGFKENL